MESENGGARTVVRGLQVGEVVRECYWCCWIISARLVLSLLKDNRGVRSHKGKSL